MKHDCYRNKNALIKGNEINLLDNTHLHKIAAPKTQNVPEGRARIGSR
jgi:hypothetical protein